MISEVYPLTMPSIDWKTYQSIMSKYCDTKVDTIDIRDPAAALLAYNLGEAHQLADALFVFGFIVVSDVTTLHLISQCTPLRVIIRESKLRGKCVGLVLGNINQWFLAVVLSCNVSAFEEVREFGNKIYMFMQQSNLRDYWKGFTTENIGTTFILKRKQVS